MISLLTTLKSQFDASAAKIAAEQAPQTAFEKFHVLTLDFRTPIIASVLYVLVVSYFSKLNRERTSSSKSTGKRSSSRGKAVEAVKEESRFTPFKCLVIAHNVLLCLYSAAVFLSALPLLARPYFNSSVLEAVRETGLNSTLYLSSTISNPLTFNISLFGNTCSFVMFKRKLSILESIFGLGTFMSVNITNFWTLPFF